MNPLDLANFAISNHGLRNSGGIERYAMTLVRGFHERGMKPVFIAKAFQGGETAEVIGTLKRHFASVKTLKPKASRSDSSELYLVATGFKGRA